MDRIKILSEYLNINVLDIKPTEYETEFFVKSTKKHYMVLIGKGEVIEEINVNTWYNKSEGIFWIRPSTIASILKIKEEKIKKFYDTENYNGLYKLIKDGFEFSKQLFEFETDRDFLLDEDNGSNGRYGFTDYFVYRICA